MEKLIEETEKLYGINIRTSDRHRHIVYLRMIITSMYPEMRLCDIARCFNFNQANLIIYRKRLEEWKKYPPADWIKAKAAFEKQDVDFFRDFIKNRAADTKKRTYRERMVTAFVPSKPKTKIKRPNISISEICDVLRKDIKSPLNNRHVNNWTSKEWDYFYELKMA